ncbi:hypothetical protein BJF92_01275 [Rhizobium rhizosphaerae]|uniref:Uncharacterized protein n=1 Tax=Xaviernesmea rhizosphaerae TaxID=1672749 RepID=A0A1Q9AEN8_9HYPH|nr:hypothetical protein [Xaviernesmea rhizosphaerae]OLP53415.1 hypothetical protein BJF92_01275 [Xaviernesmea rhizosphaerae]OQP85337.1 hypothetical protein BTR14_15635 [Xaviernesmea rhizosphaerae]
MTDASAPLASSDDLLTQARDLAAAQPEAPASALLVALANEVRALRAQLADSRREGFKEGIRGAAKVIRNRQAAEGSALAGLMNRSQEDIERFSREVEQAAEGGPITLTDLRRLRSKINAVTVGDDELDDGIRRLYYSVVHTRTPGADDIPPPGSPSRSLDVASFIVERIMQEGWWTLGKSGMRVEEKPVSKVGMYAQHNPGSHSASDGPLTLLLALVMTLIENVKRQQGA